MRPTTWCSWLTRTMPFNSPRRTCPSKYSPSKSAPSHEPTSNCVFLTCLTCSGVPSISTCPRQGSLMAQNKNTIFCPKRWTNKTTYVMYLINLITVVCVHYITMCNAQYTRMRTILSIHQLQLNCYARNLTCITERDVRNTLCILTA